MARQEINIGTSPNTQTGDDARTWATKSNANFTELYAAIGSYKIHRFVAGANQTSFTVPDGVIVDNGLWTCQVGSELWNSTTGITSFTDGNITINFATGQITFNTPLDQGTQVIFKYN